MCGYLGHQRNLAACCSEPIEGLEEFTVWACSICHARHRSPHFWPRMQELVALRHMTHVNNLRAIVRDGLLCREALAAEAFVDVSDAEVQQRRRTDPIHGRSLKSYVPLYFNPLNGMYFRELKTYPPDQLCIVEVSPTVIDLDGALVTSANAASTNVKFGQGRVGLRVVNRDETFSKRQLGEDKAHDQCRQAEVLVPLRVAPELISVLNTVDYRAAAAVQSLLGECAPPVRPSPRLFFR
jgi:hypothetical protein